MTNDASYIALDNTGQIEIQADNGTSGQVTIGAKGNILINSGAVTGGSQIELQTDLAGNVTIQSPSTICQDINVQTINGLPYGGGGGTTVSTFTQLFTSSIVMNGGYFSTLNGLGSNPVIQGDSLEIVSGTDFMLTAGNGVDLTTLSNDIVLRPGFLTPGEISFRGITNFSNHPLTNVSTINGAAYFPPGSGSNWVSTAQSQLDMNNFNIIDLAGLQGRNINMFATESLTISTIGNSILYSEGVSFIGASSFCGMIGSDVSLADTNFSTLIQLGPSVGGLLIETQENIRVSALDLQLNTNTNCCNFNMSNINQIETSSILTSTINTYPVHMAFGCGWATTDGAELALTPSVPNFVPFSRNQFNFWNALQDQFNLDENNYPMNRGIYQLNARCTFSNADSNMAEISTWINVIPGARDAATYISRCIVQIEPGRIGTTFMTVQSLVNQEISVVAYTSSPNCTYHYDPGDGVDIPPSYGMNITAQQIYSYQNEPFVYNWPPNPIPDTPPETRPLTPPA